MAKPTPRLKALARSIQLDDKIDVVDRNEDQQELPAVAIQHVAKNILVIDGDDRLPALAAHFLVDLPVANNDQNAHNKRYHTCFSFVFFLILSVTLHTCYEFSIAEIF